MNYKQHQRIVRQKIVPWLWLFAMAVFGASAIMLDASQPNGSDYYGTPLQLSSQKSKTQNSNNGTPLEKSNHKIVTVTGFSSVECHSNWCKQNAGKTRQYVVAVNAKYGKVKRVYIYAYDRYYDVIQGCPSASNTDVDIWFGDSHDDAVKQSNRQLEVAFIY